MSSSQLPRRGPGSNGGRPPAPGDQVPGMPPGMTYAAAAAITEVANRWHGFLANLQPEVTPVQCVVDVEEIVVLVDDVNPDAIDDTAPVGQMHKATRRVRLMLSTNTGVNVYSLPPQTADELSALLGEKAQEARTGIASAKSRLQLPGQ